MNTTRTIQTARTAFALALLIPMTGCFAQAGSVRAQKMAAQVQQRFAAADVNGDGRLTKEEAKDKMPFVYQHFEEIDTAHAGSVGVADITAFARAQRAARK